MKAPTSTPTATLSIVVPCYNEQETLARCVRAILGIAGPDLRVEIIIVDDGSTDNSLTVARSLEKEHPEIKVLAQSVNQGKGAALAKGFIHATGDYVVVQDADLEYDPQDIRRLIVPLAENRADVVLGSRFLSGGAHRVLYFWHSLGNRFLTLLSNMFTDLNLTDMETCYKVFRREIIQGIEIQENRFGFEPEIVAKVARLRVRIFEMGVSYYGRTYAEGKKIGVRDGFRAIYCIFRYSAGHAPLPIQFILYLFIGGAAALVNLGVFLTLTRLGLGVTIAAPTAFVLAAVVNYLLCIRILFRHRARWNSAKEILIYILVVALVGAIDLLATRMLIDAGLSLSAAKLAAAGLIVFFNFAGRRFLVFPEQPLGPWKPSRN